ncbi:MAG: PilZ domain-containing protein [Nitrospiraceae bacterium]|jgi:c-di-GMP-binding flagellar brake protein YcgR|nr:PilZ domain-containing protein [Nitrospiraceae bacterium]
MADRKKTTITNKRDFYRLDDRVQIRVKRLSALPAKDGEDVSIGSSLSDGNAFTQHFTVDISAMGAKFVSSEPFREGQYLEIRFLFRDFVAPVHINAVVLRSEKAETAVSWQIAVKFVNPASHDTTMIERYIFERQRQLIAEKRVGFL